MIPFLLRHLLVLIMIIKSAKVGINFIMNCVHMSLFTWKIILWSDHGLDRARAFDNLSILHMGQPSRLIIILCHLVVFTWIVGISFLFFLRLFLIFCKVLKLLGFVKSMIMGGDRNRVDPFSSDTLKSKTEVWERLQWGGIMSYFEKIYGNDLKVTKLFVKG